MSEEESKGELATANERGVLGLGLGLLAAASTGLGMVFMGLRPLGIAPTSDVSTAGLFAGLLVLGIAVVVDGLRTGRPWRLA